eukprot:CAMPEP_0184645228 /NCGR_PEP_ID=MMETSP0308-20130426/1735_1 /TAXON_ID=38269 /ORGANISM="Gloeochaete witrockiana, Strain SAG 46.84" /LENGTH=604 /DNA_ID=CAMNT_0027074095 /DNA_START=122 /DNA_END=1936 /DNA_ORIENTATION=-
MSRLCSSSTQSVPVSAALTSTKRSISRITSRGYAAQASVASKSNAMFCYQCEQTNKSVGCTTSGVCGKTPTVAAMQDLLIYVLKGVSFYIARTQQILGPESALSKELGIWVLRSLFTTLTNVNFDADRFVIFINEALQNRDIARKEYLAACAKKGVAPVTALSANATYVPADMSVSALEKDGRKLHSLETRSAEQGEVATGLQELITYGLKGLAAYAEHAAVQDKYDPVVPAFVCEALDFVESPAGKDADKLLQMALRVGQVNFHVLEMLDNVHTSTYGHPVPTQVLTSAVKGKAILVSGHDLRDLENVLKQTDGMGINVYTHGEMLPAHGYPGLKQKYPHLVGSYGGAWQLQKMEFPKFPGPIVMTTNCLQEPRTNYKDRIYTRGVVGWSGVQHIAGDDYSEVVSQALAMEGFDKDEPRKEITVGFGRNTVLSVADKVLEAVHNGNIRRFWVIGGCDGFEGERSYFTELAKVLPPEHVILTLGCGKFRLNHLNLGTVKGLGIPRVLDMGQCNDLYAAIQVALALSKATGLAVNDLPLSFAVSWFEQKAVAVFLTLLHLGIQGIRLGPRLPAFIPKPALDILVQQFGVRPTTDPLADFKAEIAA